MRLTAARIIATLCLVLLPLAGLAQTEQRRVALVIGNGKYEHVSELRNPLNDAKAIAEPLRRLGFDVLLGTDLGTSAMRRLVQFFGEKAKGADLALFFYAGHGVQVNGKNYLLPTDSKLESITDLDFAAIEADLIVRQMENAAGHKLVFLDACRNNPFERSLSRSLGATRSASALGRGLARIEASGGTLIAFATDPGDVALDGAGENSPFTSALLEHLETPNIEINVMLTRVRGDVFRNTDSQQRPWTSSSLIGEVYMAEDATDPPASPTPAPDQSLEIALWTAADDGGSASDYRAYLDRYPDGTFAALAKNRIAVLEAPQSTPASPPEPLEAVAPLAPPTAADVEAALNLSRSQRRDVQERLSALGHDTRGIDGVFGGGTRAALRQWQTAASLPVTGFLDQPSLDRLRQDSEPKMAGFRARRAAEAAANPRPQGRADIFRATARCTAEGISATATHADRQQAMLSAARICAERGGTPSCCAQGTTVDGG